MPKVDFNLPCEACAFQDTVPPYKCLRIQDGNIKGRDTCRICAKKYNWVNHNCGTCGVCRQRAMQKIKEIKENKRRNYLYDEDGCGLDIDMI